MRAYKMEQQRQALYAHRKKAIADDIRKMKQSAVERRKRMFGKGAGASVPQPQLSDEDIRAIAQRVMLDQRTPRPTRMWLVDTNGQLDFANYRNSSQYRAFQQGRMSAEYSVSDWIISVPLPEHYRRYDDDDEVENRLDDDDGADYDSTSETERLSSDYDTDPRMGGTGAGASIPFPPKPPPSNPNTREVFATNDIVGHISSFAPPGYTQVMGVRVNMRDTNMPLGFGGWRSRVFVTQQYYDDGTDLAIRPTTGDARRFYDEEGDEVFPNQFVPTLPWITEERDEPPNPEFFPAMGGSGLGGDDDSQVAKSQAEITEIRRQIEARRIRIEELQRKVREDKRRIAMNRKAKSMF